MGNAPSSSRSSTPPPSPPAAPRMPPRVHSPPPREALALMRGQSLTSMAQPAPATSLPSPIPPAKALDVEVKSPTAKPVVPAQRELLPEQDVGEAMPGELDSQAEEQPSLRTDWAAARLAMERAIGALRDRAEEFAKEAMERRREQRALEEEEARALHERKMTIYEDAEPGPLDELRFPPGLERGGSESEVSAIFHSSEPTTETLVEEPEQVTEEPEQITEEPEIERLLEKITEKITEKIDTQEAEEVEEVEEVVAVLREEPGAAIELSIVHEGLVASPEESQGSSEEPAKEITKVDEEDDGSQDTAPISQEALPVVTEERPLDQEPVIPSDRPSGQLEETSETQSEHLSSSIEFPRPQTPHPDFTEDPRAASPVPFPLTSDPEDQGYGTQDDEDRTTQASSRAPGKHVHWGGVEAQPAYMRSQDEEDHGEEHSPPFSRLLLPAPAPVEPQRDLRAERAARIAARRSAPVPVQKTMRKFEQGLYNATDIRWGLSLDLSGADNRSLIAFGPHGWENQQWEFQPCGAGFTIKSASNGLFLTLEDMMGLHQDGSVEVVTGHFPTCWEMEVMDNGSSEDDEGGDNDVYARIRLPHSEMALGFGGGYAGAQLFLTRDAHNMSTYWRLRAPRREQVVKNPPISTTETVHQGGMTTLITTTSVTTTTTRTVTHIVTSNA